MLAGMLISVEEASVRLAGAISCGPMERVPLGRAAGRILREALRAPRPLPPFDRAMMDGIAVGAEAFAAGRRRFRVAGRIHAGEAAPPLPSPEAACWIMTGAPCPAGAGLVVPREAVREQGNEVVVEETFAPPAGHFIHRAGADAAEGAELLAAGVRLDGPALGVAASAGVSQILVTRRPRVVVVSTGDELVEPGQPLEPQQIARSNPYAIGALLRDHLEVKLSEAHLPDARSVMRERLEALLAAYDAVVCSGGVSKGDRDFLPGVLAELGVEALFHGVAQKPGKPLWVGRGPAGQLVFGLPGNPVSALVGARRYVVPALHQWLGAAEAEPRRVTLDEAFRGPPGLTRFLPVAEANGRATPVAVGTSGDFVHLVGSTGFVELPAREEEFEAGFAAAYFGW
ncbi:MAG: molybdopterin molybdotransferase MoeA [Verrucomicrobiota bacterium]